MENVDEKECFEIIRGMDDVYLSMAKKREKTAPTCHFRKMIFEESDSTEGYCESWWECSVCGHTKRI